MYLTRCRSPPEEHVDDAHLVRLLLGEIDDHAAFTREFRAAFLRLGSATADNVNAVERIEYGIAEDGSDLPKEYAGLKLKDHGILLTDVAHAIEDLPLPEQLRAYYPQLTEADWAAATRMITMLLVSLDRAVS
jgi:hypothetical protein